MVLYFYNKSNNYWIINSYNLQMLSYILRMHNNLNYSVYLPCFRGHTVYVHETSKQFKHAQKIKYALENDQQKKYIFYFFINYNHKQLINKYNTIVIGPRSESIFLILICTDTFCNCLLLHIYPEIRIYIIYRLFINKNENIKPKFQ